MSSVRFAVTLAAVGSIPARCPVRVLATSASSAVVQRTTTGVIVDCDRADVLLPHEVERLVADEPVPF